MAILRTRIIFITTLCLIVLAFNKPAIAEATPASGPEQALNVTEGDTITLNCPYQEEGSIWQVTRGDLLHVIALGNIRVTHEFSNRLRLPNDFQLLLDNATIEDAGLYSCARRRPGGEKTNFLVTIIPKGKPEEQQKSVRLTVPELIKVNQVTIIQCDYDLGNAELFSLKLYINTREFYRYVPDDDPTTTKFDVPGLYVNLTISNPSSTSVFVKFLRNDTRTYRFVCEASTGPPSFDVFTDVAETIVDTNIVPLPDGTVIRPTPTMPTTATTKICPSEANDVLITKVESMLEYQNSAVKRQLEIAEAEHVLQQQLLPLQIEYYRRLLGIPKPSSST